LPHGILIQIAGIFVLGILSQWIAWRIRLPSILILILVGLLAGPVSGWLHPEELFGEILLPCVSLSVAIILYEGGLNLRFREISAPPPRTICSGFPGRSPRCWARF
jgi:NhaP-type Na+/H+ or K+/H+ antiporter